MEKSKFNTLKKPTITLDAETGKAIREFMDTTGKGTERVIIDIKTGDIIENPKNDPKELEVAKRRVEFRREQELTEKSKIAKAQRETWELESQEVENASTEYKKGYEKLGEQTKEAMEVEKREKDRIEKEKIEKERIAAEEKLKQENTQVVEDFLNSYELEVRNRTESIVKALEEIEPEINKINSEISQIQSEKAGFDRSLIHSARKSFSDFVGFGDGNYDKKRLGWIQKLESLEAQLRNLPGALNSAFAARNKTSEPVLTAPNLAKIPAFSGGNLEKLVSSGSAQALFTRYTKLKSESMPRDVSERITTAQSKLQDALSSTDLIMRQLGS